MQKLVRQLFSIRVVVIRDINPKTSRSRNKNENCGLNYRLYGKVE